jgi:hypothetical protein
MLQFSGFRPKGTDDVTWRSAWFEGQTNLEPERLVFVDETWASTKMARTLGRARPSERLRAAIPRAHLKTTTFVAGLRCSGMAAPMILDGAINSLEFQAYVEQVLAPELQPNDTVILDNLGSLNGPSMRATVETGARLLHLQPYSPDFNPIENALSCPLGSVRQPVEGGGEVDGAEEAGFGLVVAGGDDAPFLEPGPQVFDPMPAAVGGTIVGRRAAMGRVSKDDRLRPGGADRGPPGLGGVAPVADDPADPSERARGREQSRGGTELRLLAA